MESVEERFFLFPSSNSKKDVESDDDTTEMFSVDEIAEDDILYGQPTTFEGEKGNTLLFVHQSVEQLAILKR